MGPGDGTITVSGQLSVGELATVEYSNPTMPNQQIIIDVNDGMGGPPQQVIFHTDEHGKGSGTWTVPAWDVAVFDGPGANSVSKVIQ